MPVDWGEALIIWEKITKEEEPGKEHSLEGKKRNIEKGESGERGREGNRQNRQGNGLERCSRRTEGTEVNLIEIRVLDKDRIIE